MQVWITKYALTRGVFSVEAEVCEHGGGRMIAFRRSGEHYIEYMHSGEWHVTHSDAIDRAEDMREAKLKSLHKQIAALEKRDLTQVVPSA